MLNRRQRKFIAALLTAPTIEEAAKQAGIGERTAYRYLKHPEVKQVLSQALDDAMGQATRRAIDAMTGALETLIEIHSDKDTPKSTRVAAAKALVASGPQLREALELAERVTGLEERLTGGGQ